MSFRNLLIDQLHLSLPVATKLPFRKTLNHAGVGAPGQEQQVEPPRKLIIGPCRWRSRVSGFVRRRGYL
jgi:hypothetical protein